MTTLTPEQIAAIKFLDEHLHPHHIMALAQAGHRASWGGIDGHVSELLKLLPDESQPPQSPVTDSSDGADTGTGSEEDEKTPV